MHFWKALLTCLCSTSVKRMNGNDDSGVASSNSDLERALIPHSSDLSLVEKLSLLSGKSFWTTVDIPRLNIPSLTLSDGPHGVRKPIHEHGILESFPATCFPTACALACSWDEGLIEQVGEALQQECLNDNVHVLLGPGCNLKRHPAGGRNFEYFSEDPVLTGRLASAYIKGVQSTGKVGACMKHLAVNNQESHRFVVDALVDERTARELYYCGFEIAVKKEQPATIMCAYNRLNGFFCSEHNDLLNNVLRGEWGFQGLTMSDWGAVNDRVAGIAAGLDLEMPSSHGAHYWELTQAVQAGDLSMDDIDTSVQRMLNLIEKYGGNGRSEHDDAVQKKMWEEHYNLAHKVAMDCCVLLKNEGNFLPLKADNGLKVAVIGDFAREHPRYQGMGSSQVNSPKVVTAYNELLKYVDESNILFAPGYHADDDHVENVDQELLNEAVEVAKKANTVILCVGLPEIMESEGFDRTHLGMPAQHNALVEAICNVNPNVVVIMSGGGVVELPWYYHPKAILECFLLGEAGGQAVIDLVFGVASPSGKLAETFPERAEDILADHYFPGSRDRVEYREGLLVGYRYFDTASHPVRYPFGHGLSYTTFSYDGLKLTMVQDEEESKTVEVCLNVRNTGPMAAKEVVQCYVHDKESSVFRPDQELKDFAKIYLEPGESKQVTFMLSQRAFSFYDIGAKDWIVEKGDFEIRVGSSSRDIRLQGTITFQMGHDRASDEACSSYPPIIQGVDALDTGKVDCITFAKRFGEEKSNVLIDLLQGGGEPETSEFHRNSLLKDVANSRWLGRLLMFTVYQSASQEIAEGPYRRRQKRMMKENVKNLPLRALVLFSKGGFSFDTLDSFISLMNYHVLAATRGFARAAYHFIFRKRR